MSQPKRYEPRARSIGGPWKMVKCKDGAYVCFEQHEEIVAALAAENERLRKAGDAMADEFKFIGGGTVEGWHKAREVQS